MEVIEDSDFKKNDEKFKINYDQGEYFKFVEYHKKIFFKKLNQYYNDNQNHKYESATLIFSERGMIWEIRLNTYFKYIGPTGNIIGYGVERWYKSGHICKNLFTGF